MIIVMAKSGKLITIQMNRWKKIPIIKIGILVFLNHTNATKASSNKIVDHDSTICTAGFSNTPSNMGLNKFRRWTI